MKKNLPVTQKELFFPPEQKLISSTDLRGVIQHCNQAFVDVSGFEREELIGQPHNIIRHPDMPPAAYQSMWDQLKANQPWMGLVKNRRKNGDHYWVSAYITPVTENGSVVGYESVRSCPDRKDVDRASRLYGRLNQNQSPVSWTNKVSSLGLFLVAAAITVAGLFVAGFAPAAQGALVAAVLVHGAWSHYSQKRFRQSLMDLLSGSFSSTLAAQSYTDEVPEKGRVKVAIMSQKAHLDAVLTRIEDSAAEVTRRSDMGLELANEAQEALRQQQAETESVAAAVHEMSTTVSEVSANVQVTANEAEQSRSLTVDGKAVVESTREAIEALKNTVDEIRQSVHDLSQQTKSIASAAEIIEQIADQTNLLALNAAIEAARAGEHGRGFAVVAEEVRRLAQRTQESTTEIHSVVEALLKGSESSVRVAEQGGEAAELGLEKMLETETTLTSIGSAVNNIAEMALQMAAAVEEQAQVSDQINQQVNNISTLAQANLRKGEESTESVQGIGHIARDLHELVVRFK